MGRFIGRTREMRRLEEMLASPSIRTCAIYGRRRVGKTRLIREFCRDKRSVYLTAPGVTKDVTMESFRAVLSGFPGTDPDGVRDMGSLLNELGRLISGTRTVVVIDEFPNLATVFPEAPALLQAFIDHELVSSDSFLILSGSSIGAMGEHLNDGDSPLFQRFVMQMRLEPLPYREARLFHPDLSEEDRVRMYAIASGIPAYHEAMAGMSVEEAIETLFLETSGFLRNEAENLIALELKPRELYDSVLASIRGGECNMRSIAESSGIDRTTCTRAVNNMMTLGIVRRDQAYGRPKRVAYTITDGIVRFHYDVLSRGETALQFADSRGLYRTLSGHINMFYGSRFEDICREYVASNYPCRWIGRWWGTVPVTSGGVMVRDEDGKVQTEDADVDIVAEVLNGDNVDLLLCECKFTARMSGVRELRMLIHRGESVRRGSDNKRYVMFSRSGFTPELEDLAADEPGLRLELVGMREIGEWAGSGPSGDGARPWRFLLRRTPSPAHGRAGIRDDAPPHRRWGRGRRGGVPHGGHVPRVGGQVLRHGVLLSRREQRDRVPGGGVVPQAQAFLRDSGQAADEAHPRRAGPGGPGEDPGGAAGQVRGGPLRPLPAAQHLQDVPPGGGAPGVLRVPPRRRGHGAGRCGRRFGARRRRLRGVAAGPA